MGRPAIDPDTDKQDRLRRRVRMLNGALVGGMENWTLPLEQWELARDVILDAVDDADLERGVLLREVVATVQDTSAREADSGTHGGGGAGKTLKKTQAWLSIRRQGVRRR